MRVYLLNALTMPYEEHEGETAVFMSQRISKELFEQVIREAKESGREIVSAMGHQSTVDFLKEILSDDVRDGFRLNREMIKFSPGDIGLVFRVTERGEQFCEWALDDLRQFNEQGKVGFYLISRVHSPELFLDPSNYFSGEEKTCQ